MTTGRHPLRIARESRNLTREQLAEEVGIGASTIKRAERGEVINLHSRRQLCEFFSMTSQELSLDGEVNGLQNNSFPPVLHEEALGDYIMGNQFDPTRRNFLQMLGLAFVLPQELLNLGKGMQFSSTSIAASANEETLNQYQKLTQTCWQLSNKNGLESVEQILQIYLPGIAALAEYSSVHQKRAASIASQAYQLAYVTASHHEDFNTALSYCKQAQRYGQIAKDPNLQVASLVRKGVTFLHRKSPFQTLQSYREALQYSNDVSPLLRTRLYAGLAEVEGKLGLEEEARRSIGLAHDNFPDDPESDPTSLYTHFSRSSLFLHEGLALLDLYKPGEALQAFSKVDGLHPKMQVSERSRIDFLNQQAMAASLLGDLEVFTTYIEHAVKSSIVLGSDLRYSEAWDVYKRTRNAYPDESRVKTLAELFQTKLKQ